MSDIKEDQAPETEVTDPAQVVAEVKPTAPVTEKKETETPKNEAVTQSEWQKAQEKIKNLENIARRNEREKFEAENPIVFKEKYKDKWDEVQKLKSTPGHKYSGLTDQELLNIIRDPNATPEQRPAPTPVPSLSQSASPDVPNGEINGTVNEWLSMRYSKEQIAATKR